MNRSNFYLGLDIRDSHGACQLDMKQADTHRRLHITLTDGGVPYALTPGCQCVFTAKKPDGTVIYNLCEAENNTVIYDITPQTTAAPGLLACELRLYDSDGNDAELLTSAAFGIRVHPTVYTEEDIPASEAEVTALTKLIADTAAAGRTARSAAAEASTIAMELEEARDAGVFNGTSVTHSWNGTVLTVTSASGRSAADLKGEKGDKGNTGSPGYSPVRGKDYWTDADKAEIKAYVDEAILGGVW